MFSHSLAELSRLLHQGSISSVELTELFLARCQAHNTELNCFITLCPELALEDAKRADNLITNKLHGPLTGIPFAHKDIFVPKVSGLHVGQRCWTTFSHRMMPLW